APSPPGEEPSLAESRLWALAHVSRPSNAPDRERGRCYGTVARSRAFLGEFNRARGTALRARSYFTGSGFDLAFNASVIARIELERIRIAEELPANLDLLGAALELTNVD